MNEQEKKQDMIGNVEADGCVDLKLKGFATEVLITLIDKGQLPVVSKKKVSFFDMSVDVDLELDEMEEKSPEEELAARIAKAYRIIYGAMKDD